MRNLLAHVPKNHKEMIAATVRTVFAQPDPEATRTQLRQVVGMLETRYPDAAELLADAEHDVTAYAEFPRAHWRKIASTNPLERVHKEIKRRSNVIGIFPDDAFVIRLVGAVLAETHDDWQTSDRRYLSEGSMAQIGQQPVDLGRPPSVTFPYVSAKAIKIMARNHRMTAETRPKTTATALLRTTTINPRSIALHRPVFGKQGIPSIGVNPHPADVSGP